MLHIRESSCRFYLLPDKMADSGGLPESSCGYCSQNVDFKSQKCVKCVNCATMHHV